MKERITSTTMGLLRLMCLVLLVGAIASCGGKSKSEPTPPTPPVNPTPTPTPNPGGGTEDTKEAGIKIKIKDGTTLTVRLNAGSAKIKGETLTVGGTAKVSVTKGDIVTITGAPERLQFGNSEIEYIAIADNASGVAASLKELVFTVAEGSKGSLDAIDLTGATNLEALTLRDYGSKFTKIDLSKQGKLKKLSLGREKRDDLQRPLAEIVWPTTNVIETIELLELGIKQPVSFGSFAQLKNLTVIGSEYGSFNQEFRLEKHANIEKVTIHSALYTKSLILTDCPQLNFVRFTGPRDDNNTVSGDISVVITGCTALPASNIELGARRTDEKAARHIVEINISNNNSEGNLSTKYQPSLFSGARLKKVNISGNRLSEATITAIIAALPQGNGSQIFIGAKTSGEGNKFTEAHKNALKGKNWQVQNP